MDRVIPESEWRWFGRDDKEPSTVGADRLYETYVYARSGES